MIKRDKDQMPANFAKYAVLKDLLSKFGFRYCDKTSEWLWHNPFNGELVAVVRDEILCNPLASELILEIVLRNVRRMYKIGDETPDKEVIEIVENNPD